MKLNKYIIAVVFLMYNGFFSMAQSIYPQALIHPIDLPLRTEFCGERIDLRRWDLRERFDRELLAMNYMHSSSIQLIKKANRIFPLIEPILKANQVPDDFKYLACIESNLNSGALSPAGAAGIWQFMPETAREYGLQVDDQVDERYHLEKSTVAACKYLKDAYRKFGNWSTAAAAYNGGINRIANELEKQGVDNALDLYLNEETSRYVFRIMAAKDFMENPAKYGFIFSAEYLYMPLQYNYVSIHKSVGDWVEFAKEHGLTYLQFKEANPWLRGSRLNNPRGKIYNIAIPMESSQYFDVKNLYIHQKNWIRNK
jgi:hypothetical protein